MNHLSLPEVFELENGLTIVMQDSPGAVATTYWWNQVGSTDEEKGEEGFAHFLEHMLFKDTAAKETGQASTGKLAKSIESLGGDINAYTSFDQTVYHVTCAAKHWPKVIGIFGEMAEPLRFLKDDFVREREVILEEMRRSDDSPGRQLFQGLFSSTFSKHPYGRSVIGFKKTLNAATVRDLDRFYKKNYVPSRMGLVLVGPLGDPTERKAVMKQVEKRFGSAVLKKAKTERFPRPVEPEFRKEPKFAVKGFSVQSPSLTWSFRTPAIHHQDTPALDVAASILGSGDTARLYDSIFRQQSLVTEVSGGLYALEDAGMLYIQSDFEKTEDAGKVTEAIFKEVNRLAEEGPTQEELERVITNTESEKLYSTQTVDGVAGRLGYLKFTLGDMGFDREYLDQLRAVSVDDVKEIIKKYFAYGRAGGSLLYPKEESKPDSARLLKIVKKALERPEPKVSAKKKQDATVQFPQTWKSSKGIRVLHLYRPQSNLFSIHSSVLGGTRLEPTFGKDAWGLSSFVSDLWTEGTQDLTAQELAAKIESRAAQISGFSGRNSLGLEAIGLSRDWQEMSDLFSEVLLRPRFDEHEIENARRVTLDSIRSVEDSSGKLCSQLFLKTLFEHHPYGQPTIGLLETVEKFSRDQMLGLHSQWIQPERLTISVVGNVKPEEVRRWIESLESQFVSTEWSTSLSEPLKEGQLVAPRVIQKNLNREQIHILKGGLGTQIHSDDRYAIRLMQNILGGMSGRLFIELREKKSLAYTVAPVGFEGLESGYLGTYIGCAPSKKDEALAGIEKELAKLAEKGPTDREMKRAKEFYLGRRAMDLQSDRSLATHFGLDYLYGKEPESEEVVEKNVESVTSDQVRKVCEKYLVKPYQVTAVV